MFKAMILQVRHDLGDAKMEFMIRDRRYRMRFRKFDLGAPTPARTPSVCFATN